MGFPLPLLHATVHHGRARRLARGRCYAGLPAGHGPVPGSHCRRPRNPRYRQQNRGPAGRAGRDQLALAASPGCRRLLRLPVPAHPLRLRLRRRVRLPARLFSVLVSALFTGGVGPWMPFQMLALGWMGMAASALPGKRIRNSGEAKPSDGYWWPGVRSWALCSARS